MRIHLIIDHPSSRSFCHAVMKAFIAGGKECGHDMDILDLNEDSFNPVMTAEELSRYSNGGWLDPKVGEYQQRLKAADHLALFFPVWWMVMPARLKGWMDKVLLPGFAFTTDTVPRPLLSHITAASVLTTTAVSDAQHRGNYNNALHWVLCKGTLEFVGIQQVTWLNFGNTGLASQNEHQGWLEQVKAYARSL